MKTHGAPPPPRIIPHLHRAGSFSGYSCDIWAAGVCLWAFVFGSLPFQLEDSPDELFEAICERELAFPDTKVHIPHTDNHTHTRPPPCCPSIDPPPSDTTTTTAGGLPRAARPPPAVPPQAARGPHHPGGRAGPPLVAARRRGAGGEPPARGQRRRRWRGGGGRGGGGGGGGAALPGSAGHAAVARLLLPARVRDGGRGAGRHPLRQQLRARGAFVFRWAVGCFWSPLWVMGGYPTLEKKQTHRP